MAIWDQNTGLAVRRASDVDSVSILLADSARAQILAYDESNGIKRDVTDLFDSGEAKFYPLFLQARPDGRVLMEMTGGRFREVRPLVGQKAFNLRDLRVEAKAEATTTQEDDEARSVVTTIRRSVFVECPACRRPGDFLVGLGEIQDGKNGPWRWAMVRIPRGGNSPSSQQGFEELESGLQSITKADLGSPLHASFLLPFNLVAGQDGRVYVLWMHQQPELYFHDLTWPRESGFKRVRVELGAERPNIPLYENFTRDYPRVMEAISESTAVVGIYPLPGGDLLALYRKPAAELGTEWSVRRIQFSTDGESVRNISNRSVIKGLTADQVQVTHDGQHFVFLEQDNPLGFLTAQNTRGMYIVPTSEFLKLKPAQQATVCN